MNVKEQAERARAAARSLGEMLYDKQLAYGNSGGIALGLWEARLAQYLEPDGRHYRIPRELIAHLPRITRLDDRINRIVSNPAGDRMGEDPWLDAAGDCIIGHISPRVRAAPSDDGFDPVYRNMAARAAADDDMDMDPIEAGIPADTP